MTLSNETLCLWERLADAATPGPWGWEEQKYSSGAFTLVAPEGEEVLDDGSANGEYNQAIDPNGPDAAFIAASRAAVPALCREVRAQAAQIAALSEHIEDTHRTGDMCDNCDHPWTHHAENCWAGRLLDGTVATLAGKGET